jgi:hypothetical protein
MVKKKLTRKKLNKKKREILRLKLLFKVDTMMVDLITEFDAVKIFWELIKVKKELKSVKF